MPTYGPSDPDPEVLAETPLVWVDALPAAGSFIGQRFFLKTEVPPRWYTWNGVAMVGDLSDVSTLDADTLDGRDSLDFALTGHGHVKADIADLEPVISFGPAVDSIVKTDGVDGRVDLSLLPEVLTEIASDYETGGFTGDHIADNAIGNTELDDMAAGTVKGRLLGSGDGDPVDLTQAQQRTNIGSTATTGTADAVIQANGSGNLAPGWIATGALAPGKIAPATVGEPGLFVTDGSNSVVWKQPAVHPSTVLFKSSGASMDIVRISGTSFPTFPVDGQQHTRTDLGNTTFIYDSTRGGWLSVWEHIHYCIWAADVTTSVYVGWAPTANLFTASYGPIYGFQTKITGIGVYMAAAGTCQVGIYRSNVAITSATLSLSAETSKTNDALNSSAVAAGGYLGMKRDSGTIEGGGGVGTGYFSVRRFET